jgi:hypothetical protein
MENQINGTPKATFYLNELACEIADLFIQVKYENHYESICENGQDTDDLKYRDYVQDEYDYFYSKIETYLKISQIE